MAMSESIVSSLLNMCAGWTHLINYCPPSGHDRIGLYGSLAAGLWGSLKGLFFRDFLAGLGCQVP